MRTTISRSLPWKARRGKRDETLVAQQKTAAELAEQCLKGDASLQVTFTVFVVALGFLAGQTYSTTHEQLLLDSVVNISLGQVVGFNQSTLFWAAPLVFVGLHFRVVWLVRAAAERVLLFREKIEEFPSAVQRDANSRVASMLLSYIVEGAEPLRSVLKVAMIALLGAFPVALMLQMQLAFLPYHSEQITWIHRASVLACVAIALWCVTILRGRVSSYGLLRRAARRVPLIAATAAVAISLVVLVIPSEPLERLEVAIARALVPALVADPLPARTERSPPPRPFVPERVASPTVTKFSAGTKGVARRRYWGAAGQTSGAEQDRCDFWSSSGACGNRTAALAPIAYLFAATPRALLPDPFRLKRNLEIPDDAWLGASRLSPAERTALQEHSQLAPVTPMLSTILDALPRQSFAHRDLRFARMRGAWLVNADLDDARLDGIDLGGARLFGARVAVNIDAARPNIDGIDISGGNLKLSRRRENRDGKNWRQVSDVVAVAAFVALDGYEVQLSNWDLRQAHLSTHVSNVVGNAIAPSNRGSRRSLGGAPAKDVQPEGLVFSQCDLSFAYIVFEELMRYYSVRVESSDATGTSFWNGAGIEDSDHRRPSELVFVYSLVAWAQIFLDRQSFVHFNVTAPRYTSIQAPNARAAVPAGSIGVRTLELAPWEKFLARSVHATTDREYAPCVDWRKPQGCVPIVSTNARAFAGATAGEWCDRYRTWPFVSFPPPDIPHETVKGILERLYEVSESAAQFLVAEAQKCTESKVFRGTTWEATRSAMATEIATWRRILATSTGKERTPLGLTGRPSGGMLLV